MGARARPGALIVATALVLLGGTALVLLGGTALVLLIGALAAGGPAEAATSPRDHARHHTALPPGPVPDRVLMDGRISEASGLAVSRRDPRLLWTHNDSGHPAQLFAVRPDGRTAATVRVSGLAGADWEALGSYRDARGRPMLAVADIGDNAARRSAVEIVLLPEPPARNATVRPERVIRLRYPTGPVDAETLLVDPDGRRAFVVTKGLGSRIYQVPPDVWSSSAARAEGLLEPRAGVPLLLVTDGVLGPGGHPVVRTYTELAVLPPIDDAVTGGSLRPLATVRLPRQQQGEGLALRDARTALAGSEGVGAAILRVPLPAEVVALLSTAAPPAAPSTAAPTMRAIAPEPAVTPSRPPTSAAPLGRPWLLPVALGGLVLVTALVLAVRRS